MVSEHSPEGPPMLKDRTEEWWELVQLDGHAVSMESTGWCRLVLMSFRLLAA